MGATGTATIDFGASPGGQTTSVAVTGLATILSGSAAEAWMMGDATADHNAYEHETVPIILRVGDVVAGTGFTIYASSTFILTGTFTVHWVWA